MGYESKPWVNDETALSAENMNHLDQGISLLDDTKVNKDGDKVLTDVNFTQEYYDRINTLGEVAEDDARYVLGGDIYEAVEGAKSYSDTSIENLKAKEIQSLSNSISLIKNRLDELCGPAYKDDGVLKQVSFTANYNDLDPDTIPVIDSVINPDSDNAISNKGVSTYFQRKIEGDTKIPFEQISNRQVISFSAETGTMSISIV